MKGFTLIELLMGISVLTPMETGFVEGHRSGMLGAVVGLLVGLLVASLWIGLFYSWLERNLSRIKSGIAVWLFIVTVFFMMFALPAMAWIITHRLTAPLIASNS
jgi:prepilin-type N-terminal cleavage/methylation domain-containing protein